VSTNLDLRLQRMATKDASSSTIGLGERALELVKEMKRNANTMPMYNTDALRRAFDEVKMLADANGRDAQVCLHRNSHSHKSPLVSSPLAQLRAFSP